MLLSAALIIRTHTSGSYVGLAPWADTNKIDSESKRATL